MTKIPMNLPNRITLLRMLLIPVYFILMAIDTALCQWIAAAVFAIAALTDFIDGRLARKRGEVTTFGKFVDPIADKLLTLLPLILFTARGTVSPWAVILMIARELIVSGFRLVAVTRSIVIAADWSGKIKTCLQILVVLALTEPALLLNLNPAPLIWLTAIVSVVSGFEMIWKNRRVLEEQA